LGIFLAGILEHFLGQPLAKFLKEISISSTKQDKLQTFSMFSGKVDVCF
jgi:hypothetical protein